jgi:hypothetical protein
MPSHAWQVKTAEEIGAHHLVNGMPREDAAAVVPANSWDRAAGTVSVAVADGHGHARHFRSEHGSAIAVDVATRLGSAFGRKLAAMTDARAIEKTLRAEVGPAIVGGWRDTVIAHIGKHPVTDDEFSAAGLARNASIDELIFGYGATLLVAVAAGQWLAFLQIGDGDLFVVGANGRVTHPLPIDPRLDGLRTTSLCQPDALQSMRYAAVDATADGVGAVMMATDGYGNAQVRNDWEAAFGQDLAALAAKRGVEWIGDQLHSWVAQCASSDGSGDDVTAALMFATDAKWGAPRDTDATVTINDAPAEARTEVLTKVESTQSDMPTTRQLPTVPPPAEAPAPRAAAAARLPGAARHRATAPDEGRTVVDGEQPAQTIQIPATPRPAPAPRATVPAAPPARTAAPAASSTTRHVTAPSKAPAAPAAPVAVPAPAEKAERSKRAIWVLLLLIVVVIGVLVALISVMWKGSDTPPPAPSPTFTSVSPGPSTPTAPAPGRPTQSGGLGGVGQASASPPSTQN